LAFIPITLTQFAYQAARDLGCLRAGQTLSADILSDIKDAANQLLDAWLIEEMLVPDSPASVFDLTAGLQTYQIGPGQVAPNFDADRPTEIRLANIILNTVTPVLRTPLEIINVDQWAAIAVQDLPDTLPTRLYYERSFNVTTGYSRILIWGGAISAYQLELFTNDQSVLRAFDDLTTARIYPPGYANMIRKNLAVAIAPLMTMYCKSSRADRPMAPSGSMLSLVQKQAIDARLSVESYNADDAILTGDPAYLGNSARRGWNYLLGTDSRTGR
jgi:hypothetical protein